jgi:hypothetical protein
VVPAVSSAQSGGFLCYAPGSRDGGRTGLCHGTAVSRSAYYTPPKNALELPHTSKLQRM